MIPITHIKNYDVTAHVDEVAEIIYEITIWHKHPTKDGDCVLERFQPETAETKLEIKALEAIYDLYDCYPVIEN